MDWYPIIDEVSCIKCGVCMDQCNYDVFDKSLGSQPVVSKPDNCLSGCSSCGCSCPTGAIIFYHEDQYNRDQLKVCCGCGQQCQMNC